MHRIGAFEALIAKASEAGLRFPRDRMIGVVFPARREMVCVASRVEDADVTDEVRHSIAERTGYAQLPEIFRFVREWMPGGGAAQIVSSGHSLGIRESRHVACHYGLTGADLLAGRIFDDTIAMGSYHIDIHSPDRKGLEPLTQTPPYGIPYRSLLPKGVRGLMMAGRCLGADHQAEAAVRVIPILAAIGQAAGTAAALAAKEGVPPETLSGTALRDLLREQGAIVDAP